MLVCDDLAEWAGVREEAECIEAEHDEGGVSRRVFRVGVST